jgi:peroxiredoxin
MQIALLTSRFLLSAIFIAASLSKFADRDGFRKTLRELEIPSALTGVLVFVIPAVELASAMALIFKVFAWWGGAAALVLLVGFTSAISISLLRGKRPNCRCFGGLAAAPIGEFTLARNAAFIVVAGFVVIEGWTDVGPSAADLLTGLSLGQALAAAGVLIALCTLFAQAWFLMQLLQQQGRIILRFEALEAKLEAGAPRTVLPFRSSPQLLNGLPIGSPAPTFSLLGLYGETLTLAALLGAGKPVLLVFVDPDCRPCTTLLPQLAQWQRRLANALVIALVGRGSQEVNRAKASGHGLVQVLLQIDNEVAEAYQVNGTPSAVLLGSNGAIASPVAEGAEAIRALVERTGQPVPRSVPALLRRADSNGDGRCPDCSREHRRDNGHAIPPATIGDPAPPVRLPDLSGHAVDLAESRGLPTVAVFWQPSCHFCQELLPELKAIENSCDEGGVLLLVISTGSLEENARLGVRSPVLLAPDFSVGSAFGVTGTPSAVLLDTEGRIASSIAVGGPAVLALARDAAIDNRPAGSVN